MPDGWPDTFRIDAEYAPVLPGDDIAAFNATFEDVHRRTRALV